MNEPIKKYKDGGMSIAVFEHEQTYDDQTKKVYSYVLEKSYKDKEGNWQHTNSLRNTDLLKTANLLIEAYNDTKNQN